MAARSGVPKFVYVAENAELNFCKVGSTLNIRNRDIELGRTYRSPIMFYVWAADGEGLERLLHDRLKSSRVRVRMIQLPGRKPVLKASLECYRIDSDSIIDLIPTVAKENGIEIRDEEPIKPIEPKKYVERFPARRGRRKSVVDLPMWPFLNAR